MSDRLPSDRLPDVSRRALVRNAAWTVPVIGVVAAAPAFAASAACTIGTQPVTRSSWRMTAGELAVWDKDTTGWLPVVSGSPGGDNNSAGRDWHNSPGNGFASSSDARNAKQWTTLVVEYVVPVIAGADYSIAQQLKTFYAGGDAGSERQDVTIELIHGAQTVPIAKVATDGQNQATTDAQMLAQGFVVQPEYVATQTYRAGFTAAAAGTATVRYTFRLHPLPVPKPDSGENVRGYWVNRDILTGVPTISITKCP